VLTDTVDVLIAYSAVLCSAVLWWHHLSVRTRRTRLWASAVSLLCLGMWLSRSLPTRSLLVAEPLTGADWVAAAFAVSLILLFIPCMSVALDIALGREVGRHATWRMALQLIVAPMIVLSFAAYALSQFARQGQVEVSYVIIVRFGIVAMLGIVLIPRLLRLRRANPRVRGVDAMIAVLVGASLHIGYRALEIGWVFLFRDRPTVAGSGIAVALLLMMVTLSFGAWFLLLDLEREEAVQVAGRMARAEEELQGARTQLLAAFDSSADPLALLDDQGHLQLWNSAFAARAAARGLPAPASNTPMVQYAPPTVADRWAGAVRDLLKGGRVDPLEYVLEEKGGRETLLLSPVREGVGGAVTGAVAQVRDVTEVRALTERLRRTELMERLGQMAAGVAHDFNHLLGIIVMSTDLAEQSATATPQVREELSHVRAAAERGRLLTRQLLAFARQQPGDEAIFDANERLHGLEGAILRLGKRPMSIRLETPPGPSFVRMDATQFDQVVLNLAANAIDASKDHGEVVVSIARRTRDHDGRHPPGSPTASAFVVVAVRDAGCGIPPELIERVFEPFVSTKQESGGTGLGLATCYGIARKAGGTVRLSSRVNEGTEVEVWLPAA